MNLINIARGKANAFRCIIRYLPTITYLLDNHFTADDMTDMAIYIEHGDITKMKKKVGEVVLRDKIYHLMDIEELYQVARALGIKSTRYKTKPKLIQEIYEKQGIS